MIFLYCGKEVREKNQRSICHEKQKEHYRNRIRPCPCRKHHRRIGGYRFALLANNRKNPPTETLPEIVSVNSPDDCGVPSIGSFVKDMNSLTEKEREALLGDLAEIAKLEKQIDEIYARMTDKNAEKLYKEISAIDDKITAVLERNSKLWERVNDEYDEQIAANETDMTLELNEADLNDAREDEYAYEKFVRNLDTITEDERAALIADLAKVAELNEKIDAIYARMTDKNADKLYEEIDAVEAEITEVLERNSKLWDRVSDEYDVRVAANEADMAF